MGETIWTYNIKRGEIVMGTEKCTKCNEVLWFYAEDTARGKVIKVCKNPNCTMYNFKISFSER